LASIPHHHRYHRPAFLGPPLKIMEATLVRKPATAKKKEKEEKQEQKTNDVSNKQVDDEQDMMDRLADLGVFEEANPEALMDEIKSRKDLEAAIQEEEAKYGKVIAHTTTKDSEMDPAIDNSIASAAAIEVVDDEEEIQEAKQKGKSDAPDAPPAEEEEEEEEESQDIEEKVSKRVPSADEQLVNELYEQEQKREVAREIIYEQILQNVFEKAEEKRQQQAPVQIQLDEVQVVTVDSVNTGDLQTVRVQPIVIDSASVQRVEDVKSTATATSPVAPVVVPVTPVAKENVASPVVVEQPTEEEVKDPGLQQKHPSILVTVEDVPVVDVKQEMKIENKEPLSLAQVLNQAQAIVSPTTMTPAQPAIVFHQLEQQQVEAEQQSLRVCEGERLLVEDLQPLTSVMDWVTQDEKMRLKSDLVALGLMKAHDQTANRDLAQFKASSRVDKKSKFYRLVNVFFEAERRLASAPVLLEARRAQFKTLLTAMWPRETKVISQTQVGAKNGVQVKHDFSYERTWVSENDAKALVKTMQAEGQVLLPELAKQRFEDRCAFLHIEMYLYEVYQDNSADQKLYPSALSPQDGHQGGRVSRMLRCADVLFHFLRKPGSVASFVESVNKWIKIINTWVYREGTNQDQEYIFRHMIQTKGGLLRRFHHAPQFPIEVDKWGDDVSRHFLKVMYLLLSPLVTEDKSNDPNNQHKNAQIEGNNHNDLERSNRSTSLLVMAEADVKSEVADAKAWKAALSEEDLVHLAQSLPVKEFLNHIFLEAFTKAAKVFAAIGEWEAHIHKAMGTAKAIMYMIGKAMNALPQYLVFREQLCKILCWTVQCLVDSYTAAASKRHGSDDRAMPMRPPGLIQGATNRDTHGDSSNPQTLSSPFARERNGNTFAALVWRELDWLCARCVALVNASKSPKCKAYLCMFPLSHLSPNGASLTFQVIYRNLPVSNLLDSGYQVESLDFDGWQTAMQYNPKMRTSFFQPFVGAGSKTDAETKDNDGKDNKDQKENSEADGEPESPSTLMAPVVALNTLAEKQPEGSPLPRIWMRELFLAAFVRPDTSPSLSVRAQPLISSLCAYHPAATSQLLQDAAEHFFNQPKGRLNASSSGELQTLILRLDLSNYDASSADCETLRRFLELPSDFCASLATAIIERYNYPNPAGAVDPKSVDAKRHPSARAEAELMQRRLASVVERVLPMLGEVRLAHYISRNNAQQRAGRGGKRVPGPPLSWWVGILAKIATHDMQGRPLASLQAQKAQFPSQACLDRLGGVSSSQALQCVTSDPILRYIGLVLGESPGSSYASFRDGCWPSVRWLIEKGQPAARLGYQAVFSLLPSVAGAREMYKAGELLLMPVLMHEDQKRSTWFGGSARAAGDAVAMVRGLMQAHIASLAVVEMQLLKAQLPNARWNSLFASNGAYGGEGGAAGEVKGDAKQRRGNNNQANARTPPAPLFPAPLSPTDLELQRAVDAAMANSRGADAKIVSVWLTQFTARDRALAQAADRPTPTGVSGRGGWLSDPVFRGLMDDLIHALYRLTPVKANRNGGHLDDALHPLTTFLQAYIKEHGRQNPRQRQGSGLEPPLSPLGKREATVVRSAWLTFQVLTEMTALNLTSWQSLGRTCVERVTAKKIWKRVLKDVDPTNNKVILWESIIREWVRHAVCVAPDHPLLPAYWQRFFALYFSRLGDDDSASCAERAINPQRFYGFRYMLGNTGDGLVQKALRRLKFLTKYWETRRGRGGAELRRLYRAMHLWLQVRPREAGAEVRRWGPLPNSGQGFGLSEEQVRFLASPCPRGLNPATAWRVNQLALRASLGCLPAELCADRLVSVIADDGIDRSRRTMWMLDVDVNGGGGAETYAEDVRTIRDQVKSFIRRPVFASIFSLSRTGTLALEAPAASPQTKRMRKQRSRTYHEARARKLLLPSSSDMKQSQQLQHQHGGNSLEDAVLVLPANLRAPVSESLGDHVINEVRVAMEGACKSYEERVGRLQALTLSIKQLIRGLYKNEPKTTTFNRPANGGLFKATEEVTFTFKHTEVKEVSAVRKELDKNRNAVLVTLRECPEHEVFLGRGGQVGDLCSHLVLVSKVAEYLIGIFTSLRSPGARFQDDAAVGNAREIALRWLYALVEMEGPITKRYPVTRDHLVPVIGRLAEFVPVTVAAQVRLIEALRDHPSLVPQLKAALRPMELFQDRRSISNVMHSHFVALFSQACQLRVVICQEATQLVDTQLLERFRIPDWLATCQPAASTVTTVLNTVSAVLRQQFAQDPRKAVSNALLGDFARIQAEAIAFLSETFTACAAHEFPRHFEVAWGLLLQSATCYPITLPPSLWTLLAARVPLTKLRWSKIIDAVQQVGRHVQSCAADTKLVQSAIEHHNTTNGKEEKTDGGKNTMKAAASRLQGLPYVYVVSLGCEDAVLSFINELVAAGMRKLHFVKARVSQNTPDNPSMTMARLQETLQGNLNEIWDAVWVAFAPFFVSHLEQRQLEEVADDGLEGHIRPLSIVCRRFAELVLLLVHPERLIPVSSQTGLSKRSLFQLWKPQESIDAFFGLYSSNIARCAQPRVLTYLNQELSLPQRLMLNSKRDDANAPVPIAWGEFRWETRHCRMASDLLASYWTQLKGEDKASYTVQEAADFISRLLVDGDAFAMMSYEDVNDAKNVNALSGGSSEYGGLYADAKEENYSGDVKTVMSAETKARASQFSMALLSIVSQCCLILPTPYADGFSTIIRKLITYRHWNVIDCTQYENLLVGTSELLYKKPGYDFKNTQKPKPKPMTRPTSPRRNNVQDLQHQISSLPQPSNSGANSQVSQSKHAAAKKIRDAIVQGDDWVPAYREDRAAFVLRLMMSMALPHPATMSAVELKEALLKTHLYTEWLLSVFHKEGPKPVTKNIEWYVQLSKQVLTHLNNHANVILERADRKHMIEILEEFSRGAEAADAHELKMLSKTLTTNFPNLVYELMASICRSTNSLNMATASKIENCIVTALGRVDMARYNSQREIYKREIGASSGNSIGNDSEGGSTATQSPNTSRLGSRGFGWKLVAENLEIPEDGHEDFFNASVTSGCPFSMCGLALRKIAKVLPGAFESNDEKGGEADPGLKGFTEAHTAIMSVVDNITFVTSTRIEKAEGKTEKIRELEHALLSVVRLILSAEIRIIQYARKGNYAYKGQVTDNANVAISELGVYLRKAYHDGKFGSSAIKRFGGRITQFFGKKSTEELTPRFRLLGRALKTFIDMREDEASGSKSKGTTYFWDQNALEQTKAQQKVLKHFVDMTRAKPFRYLTRHIQEITASLQSSTLTLLEADKFFTEVTVQLFPGLPWPTHWWEPDAAFPRARR